MEGLDLVAGRWPANGMRFQYNLKVTSLPLCVCVLCVCVCVCSQFTSIFNTHNPLQYTSLYKQTKKERNKETNVIP